MAHPQHWLFFLGYGGVLASLSITLRFWDLFAIRTVLYPLYIANAPHTRFESRSCRPLRVFQLPLFLFNALLHAAVDTQAGTVLGPHAVQESAAHPPHGATEAPEESVRGDEAEH